ncbi:MAG TPA: hypothetical protein VGK20_17785 [Candidatus Binatia bacterium]|jgi:hypothetical protein
MNASLRQVLLRAGISAAVVIAASPSAHALEKCKAKIDKKTGIIYVDAGGIAGPLLWGAYSGAEENPFFNDATCIAGDIAKACQIQDPSSLGSKTPPAGCSIYLDDGVSTPCSVWLPSCTPGVRLSDEQGLVDGAHLAPDSIGSANVADGSLTGADVQDGSLTGTDIQSGSITGTQIADGSITGADISDGTITGTDIAASTITGSNVSDGSLTGADLAAGSIGSNEVADESLTGSDIEDGSLTGSDVQDESLTGADIQDGSIGSSDVDDTQVQLRLSSGCAAGSGIAGVADDGTVTCSPFSATTTTYGGGSTPTSSIAFLTTFASASVTSGQQVQVTASKAFGSTNVGGGQNLRIYPCYHLSGDPGPPSTLGNGIFDLRVPQDTRVTFSVSGTFPSLATGQYEFGMCGYENGLVGPSSWNSNDQGYVSVVVM